MGAALPELARFPAPDKLAKCGKFYTELSLVPESLSIYLTRAKGLLAEGLLFQKRFSTETGEGPPPAPKATCRPRRPGLGAAPRQPPCARPAPLAETARGGVSSPWVRARCHGRLLTPSRPGGGQDVH